MIPPVWTGLPKNISGTVIKLYEEDDSYDVLLDSGMKLERIPINYMRPDNILCSGKNVKKSNAFEMLCDKKYKIPTY